MGLVAGCKDEPEVASPSCADLEQTTVPILRADLINKCPRAIQEIPEATKPKETTVEPKTKTNVLPKAKKPNHHGSGFVPSPVRSW